MENVYNLDLTLGFKTFRVKFAEFDESVDILFNPADADLPKRLFEAEKRIKAMAAEVGDLKLNPDGTPETDAYIEQATAINEAIYGAVDYAFGNKISDKLFSHCSPLAITAGQPFIIQFFEKITPVLQQIIEQENKAATAGTKKYLDKYKITHIADKLSDIKAEIEQEAKGE